MDWADATLLGMLAFFSAILLPDLSLPQPRLQRVLEFTEGRLRAMNDWGQRLLSRLFRRQDD